MAGAVAESKTMEVFTDHTAMDHCCSLSRNLEWPSISGPMIGMLESSSLCIQPSLHSLHTQRTFHSRSNSRSLLWPTKPTIVSGSMRFSIHSGHKCSLLMLVLLPQKIHWRIGGNACAKAQRLFQESEESRRTGQINQET